MSFRGRSGLVVVFHPPNSCHESARFYGAPFIARYIPISFPIRRPLSRGRIKKNAVPANWNGVSCLRLAPDRPPCRARAITRAFQIARTQHSVHPTTGRFSGLRLTGRLLPIRRRRIVDRAFLQDLESEIRDFQGARCLGDFRMCFGTDAHSGATVADFHRVPVCVSQGKDPETCSRIMHLVKNRSDVTGGSG